MLIILYRELHAPSDQNYLIGLPMSYMYTNEHCIRLIVY